MEMQKKTSHIGLSSSPKATDLPACALLVMSKLRNLLKICKLLEKIFIRISHSVRQRAWLLWEKTLTQLLPRAANKCLDNKWKLLLSDMFPPAGVKIE